MKKFVWLLLGFFVLGSGTIFLSGCHHSDGNSAFFGAGGTSKGGVNTFSRGVVTAKGSIIVNGVEFGTNGAVITVNGHPGVASDLKVGEVVTVKGKASGTKGTASQVVFSSDLLGPISSIATGTTGTTVTVLGQTVIIDDKTVLSSFGTGTSDSLASLNTGSIIEVSGLPDSTGNIHASFVSRPTASVLEYSIRGIVSATTGSTFTLTPHRNGTPLTVNIVSGPTPSTAAGQVVDVKIDPGTIDPATFTASTPITAKSVTVEKELTPAENDVVFVEGFVTAPTGTAASANTFEVDGITVDAGSISIPPVDTHVIVHGVFSGGVVLADRIELAGISKFTIGALTSISTSTTGTTGAQKGTKIVVINGSEFNISTAKIKVNGKTGTLNDLEAGMQAIVKSAATLSTAATGTTGLGATGTATQLWIVDNLTGPISSTSGTLLLSGITGTSTGTVTVFGQNIKIDGNTRFGKNLVSSETGSVVSLAAGSVINVSGVSDGTGSILATFINSKPTATQYHVLGLVSAVTGSPATGFTLTPDGGTPLTVTLATGVTTTTGFADGQLVDVKIDPATVTEPASTAIIAQSVDIVNQPKPADKDVVDVEGIVSNLSGNTFTVNGINVDGSGLSGGMPFGLANGSKVRVRGVMSGTTLMAEAIVITG